jgi:hypothetical protein
VCNVALDFGAPELDTVVMPHYYFDLTDDKTIHDLKGKKLAGLDEARQHAVAMARDLIDTRSTLLSEPLSAWSISVKDERFSKVLSVPVLKEERP